MSSASGRLIVGEEVRALLSTDDVAQAIATRNHTELNCPACLGTIAPEDDTPVSVVLTPDLSTGHMRMQYAHATCSPSVVREPEAMAANTTPAIGRRTIRAVPPRAVAVIEEVAGSATMLLDGLASRGFTRSEDGALHTTGTPAAGVVMVRDGWDFVIVDRITGLEINRLYGSPDLGDWTAALEQDQAAYIVIGASLGLERFDPARVDAQLADGKALGAVVVLDEAWSKPPKA